jgi:hypothetical protein
VLVVSKYSLLLVYLCIKQCGGEQSLAGTVVFQRRCIEKDGARMAWNISNISFIARSYWILFHEVYKSWTRANTIYFLITLGYSFFQTNMKFIAIIALLVVVGSEAFAPGVQMSHTSTGE